MVKIDKIDFGEIVIDGKSFYSDVSINVNGEVEHLAKKHVVGANELAPLLKGGPDCVVIGTGMEGSIEVEETVGQILDDKGIKLFCDDTSDAAEIFNGLVANKKKVAGLFHLTS